MYPRGTIHRVRRETVSSERAHTPARQRAAVRAADPRQCSRDPMRALRACLGAPYTGRSSRWCRRCWGRSLSPPRESQLRCAASQAKHAAGKTLGIRMKREGKGRQGIRLLRFGAYASSKRVRVGARAGARLSSETMHTPPGCGSPLTNELLQNSQPARRHSEHVARLGTPQVYSLRTRGGSIWVHVGARGCTWERACGGGWGRSQAVGFRRGPARPSTTGGELTFARRKERLSSRREKHVPTPEKRRTGRRPSLRGSGCVGGCTRVGTRVGWVGVWVPQPTGRWRRTRRAPRRR